jgi:pimeloyl-ACP methyl ester carboxylesterase
LKSSSQLFPVELVSAEHRDGYFEDLYSLKPNRSQDKTVEIALLHLHASAQTSSNKAILFVHDAFSTHWQWMDGGDTEAAIMDLLETGYSVWLMDWRAHGSSKKNRSPWLNSIEEMAQEDLIPVVEFMEEKQQIDIAIASKGYGSRMVLHALPYLNQVKRTVLIDAQSILPSIKYWIPLYRFKKLLPLMGKGFIYSKNGEAENKVLFKSHVWKGGILGFFTSRGERALALEIRKHSANLVWVCTQKRFEWRARRISKDQSRIQRLSFHEAMRNLSKLITS